MISRGFMSDSEKRRKQIDTLKIFNDNVIEISENEEYRVEFKSDGRNMSICVRLCPAFPVEKPQLIISPVVRHPWVQQHTGEIIEAPGLLNFTVHSDLGRVVQAIIREFERNPPGTIDTAMVMPIKDKIICHDPTEITDMPVLESTILNDLAQMNKEQLEKLLNPDRIDDFLESQTQVQKRTTELSTTMQHVESLATATIEKQMQLEKLKENISTKLEFVMDLKMKYELLNEQHQHMADQYAPQNICELLQKAAAASDEDCENIAARFLDGECNIDTFISEFMNARKLSQTRKIKEERLESQLNALERAGF